MKKYVISVHLQSEFISALKMNNLKDWQCSNQTYLKGISQLLKRVKVPRSDTIREDLCEFILTWFLALFDIKSLPEIAETSKAAVKQFIQELMKSYENKRWTHFYNTYEYYFDSVLGYARDQKIVDIRLEGVNKKKVRTFHEACELLEKQSICSEYVWVRSRSEHKDNLSIHAMNPCKVQKQNDGMEGYRVPLMGRFLRYISRKEPTEAEGQNVNKEGSELVITHSRNSHNEFTPNVELEDNSEKPNVRLSSSSRFSFGSKSTLEDSGLQTTKISNGSVNRSLVIITNNDAVEELQIGINRNEEREGTFENTNVHRRTSMLSNASSITSKSDSEVDESFQKKLNSANEKFAEQLRKLKEKRARKNREAEDERRKLRDESAAKLRALLSCILLRARWEEQSEEWDAWLKCARAPIKRVKMQFFNFKNNLQRNSKEENVEDKLFVFKCTQIAYDELVDRFDCLALLSDEYEDILFLKVIQKRISTVANKLCYFMDELESLQNEENHFSLLTALEADIDPNEIPTSSELSKICKTAQIKDYSFVFPPKQPKSHCNISDV